jgi:uncharacterized membrane protein YdjX (TVP38/TMEM64 family)
MNPALHEIGRRLGRKIGALIPILLGSAVLFGLASLLALAVRPYLPGRARSVVELLQAGDFARSRDQLLALLDSYGPAQYPIFVLIQVAQVVLAPIPGQLTGLLGGYLFGFWPGLALTMLGLAVGSGIAVAVGRLLGVAVVRRLVPPRLLARFDGLIDEAGVGTFLLIFLLPVFPDDAVCFMAGLTRLPIWQVVLVSAIGRLPSMAGLTYLGATGGRLPAPVTAALAIGAVAAVALWLYSEEVEDWLHLRFIAARRRLSAGRSSQR